MKTHSDHCRCICIGCLKKGKSLRPIVKVRADNLSDSSLKFRVLSQFKLDSEDLNHLPTVICSVCRKNVLDLTISAPDYKEKVDYNGFIANVKKYLNQNEDCECEICYIGSASLCADPSRFLLPVEKNVVQSKKPDLTDYFPQKKNATKREIASSVIENASKSSVEQFIALALDKTECDSEECYIKNIQGQKLFTEIRYY